jgi:hypothetical protein
MPCKASSVYDWDLATAAAAAATQARAAAARSAARAPPQRIHSDNSTAAAPEPGLNRAMQVRCRTLNPQPSYRAALDHVGWLVCVLAVGLWKGWLHADVQG